MNYRQPYTLNTPIIIKYDDISSKLINVILCTISKDYIFEKAERTTYKLLYYEILMVYPENHYLNIVMENRTLKTRKSIKEISDDLESHGFAISSASTYINLYRVKFINKHFVNFDNNLRINVSRYKYKALVQKFNEKV